MEVFPGPVDDIVKVRQGSVVGYDQWDTIGCRFLFVGKEGVPIL